MDIPKIEYRLLKSCILVFFFFITGCMAETNHSHDLVSSIQSVLPDKWKVSVENSQIVISSQKDSYFFNPMSMPDISIEQYVLENGFKTRFKVYLTFGTLINPLLHEALLKENKASELILKDMQNHVLPIYRKYDPKFAFHINEPTLIRAPVFFKRFSKEDLQKAEEYEIRKKTLIFHPLPTFYTAKESIYLSDNNIFELSVYPIEVAREAELIKRSLSKIFKVYNVNDNQKRGQKRGHLDH